MAGRDSDDDASPDAVAKRLRDKIRLQAESLLSRCDNHPSSVSRSTSREFSRPSSFQDVRTVDTSSVVDASAAAVITPNGPEISPNSNHSVASNPSSANANTDLTKRIQRLALERQMRLDEDDAKNRLRIIQSDAASHLSSIKTFEELQLPKHLLNAVYTMGFNRPSAIQEAALPRIIAGRNVIGQAQSGSGKTAAFTIGMLYRIDTTRSTTQAMCVTPTRELAIQIVEKAIRPMSINMVPALELQLAVSQSNPPTHTPHLVVGTPGKLVDWMKRRILSAKHMQVFVLDEADSMVEAGSGHRANSLLLQKQLPPHCQRLFFSATFSPLVIHFASKMVANADKILIEDGPEYLVLDVIKQLWVDTRTYRGGKLEFLADIYSLLTIGQSIVFVGRKDDADDVHRTLHQAGFTCSVLHGAVEPATRDAVMDAFRKGESNVLITTNVLARGVDVDNVCLVINYDMPISKDNLPDYETYLHRIGRTGRFGRKGTAINLIGDEASLEVLQRIEGHFAKSPNTVMIEHAVADPEALADVIEI